MRRVLKVVCVAAVLAVAPLTMACDRQGDQPGVEARVNDQLKTANLDNKVNVDWKADEKGVKDVVNKLDVDPQRKIDTRDRN